VDDLCPQDRFQPVHGISFSETEYGPIIGAFPNRCQTKAAPFEIPQSLTYVSRRMERHLWL
jgi:hypothetical protein